MVNVWKLHGRVKLTNNNIHRTMIFPFNHGKTLSMFYETQTLVLD